MHPYPHHYVVRASAAPEGDVPISAERLPTLQTAPPAEFDGPGDRWSPETLVAAAVGDCLILTFRSVTAASKVPWTFLQCRVSGTLDRIDRVTQFTGFEIHATLTVPPGTSPDAARHALEKADRVCLITNSLKGATRLVATIEVAAVDELAPA